MIASGDRNRVGAKPVEDKYFLFGVMAVAFVAVPGNHSRLFLRIRTGQK